VPSFCVTRQTATEQELSMLSRLTPEEIARYNYIKIEKGDAQAGLYLKTLENDLLKRTEADINTMPEDNLESYTQNPQDVLESNTDGIIIDKSQGVELSRYVNSNDKLYEYAQNIPPLEGYEDQIIHGDKNGFEVRDADGKTVSVYTPREFAEVLRQDPNYHGGNIRLISCYTGAEDGIAAQALANQLGVDVLAPNDVLIVYPDGSMKIGHDGNGKWILYGKR